VSAFYISNRKDGFVLSGSILAKSKFYGNSLSAILDGVARLVFLKRGEDYLLSMPYAHCKGSNITALYCDSSIVFSFSSFTSDEFSSVAPCGFRSVLE